MRIVCELSGGADSALAACIAHKNYPDAGIYALFVNYGQKYWKEEETFSLRLAGYLDFAFKGVCIEGLFGKFHANNGMAKEYFPLRNMVLSSIALSYAETLGAEMVVTGSKSLVPVISDPYSFKDSTALFYNTMNHAASTAGSKIEIRQLLAEDRTQKMSKEMVYDALENYYGVRLFDTFSCYNPKHPYEPWKDGILESCAEKGGCVNCKEKEAYRIKMGK